MAKGKMPPQLVEYFKNKNKEKDDGTKLSDKEKRKEALDKATKAKQKMMVQAEMMKQLQPTVPEVTADNIDLQPMINPNPKPEGPVIGANVFNPGNLYPGISGTSKLAANWNPMMDPAAG